MKKQTLVTIYLIAISLNCSSQITFQRSYGTSYGAGNISTNEVSIICNNNGGYTIAGTINANGGDAYLMKLNAMGDTIWTRTYGGNFDDVIYAAIQTTDSCYILVGQTRSFSMGQSDAYIIKTNSNGNIIWSKNIGGFDWDWFSSIQQTDDGNFIACGTTFTFGSGIEDVYLVKISSSGNIMWTKTFGSGSWERGSHAQQTYDNGYIISGFTKGFTAASGRIYLVKTDSVGNTIWSKIFGGVMGDEAYFVKQCSDSGFIVTGYCNSFGAGAQDVFLIKTDASGNLNWMKTYGGSGAEEGYYVQETTDFGFIIAGRSSSFGTSNQSDYLIKTNASGDLEWSKIYPCQISNGHFVQQTDDGGFIMASNPNTFRIVKTDSLGNSGCNENIANTIENTATPIILSGAVMNSGGVANNSATLTRYTLAAPGTLCISTNVVDDIENVQKINVFPNPFSDELVFSTEENKSLYLVLYDVVLRKIYQTAFIKSVTLNTEQLSKGIYIYEVCSKEGLCKKGKVVKD